MTVPDPLHIYHIVHIDRLASILDDGHLWCDAEVIKRRSAGTTIGMSTIKARRLSMSLQSHPGLMVGACVPFYFSPRSVMLYLLHMGNHAEITYRGGQAPIVHLQSDFHQTIAWAHAQGLRWAFTLSNASARYTEDRCDVAALTEIQWEAVNATRWSGVKEGKQAEFLIEHCFPWHLVERIGAHSLPTVQRLSGILQSRDHRPPVEIKPSWYY